MVGVTYVHGFSFFFMSITLRVEDGSFGFGAEGWTVLLFSSFFFLVFFFYSLPFFSSIFSQISLVLPGDEIGTWIPSIHESWLLIRLERIPSHWLKNTNLVLPIQGCQS
jgi:hypothetical protein